MDNMDALKERVLSERIRILNAKLEVAIRQRDGFASNYHGVIRVPYQECREIMRDCDTELEQAGQPQIPGKDD